MSLVRVRWAAAGAAIAVAVGAGGFALVGATEPVDAATFVSITPCRVIDTRPAFNVGVKNTPLGEGETHTVRAHGTNGDCSGIPTTAVAVSLNVTATDATSPTFLTIWASGASKPDASSLNPTPGAPPTPNAVVTEVNGNGEFAIFNRFGRVHVLADINGYYVDHTHDDRYYTEAEVDEAIGDAISTAGGSVGPKSISLDPSSFHVENGAFYTTNGAGGNFAGVRLPDDGGQPNFTFHVTLPADFVTGSEPVIDMYWRIAETGCATALEWVPIVGERLGQTGLGVGGDDVPYIKVGSFAVNEVRRISVRLSTGGGGLRAGDTIVTGLFRNADSCTDPIVVVGGRLTYP